MHSYYCCFQDYEPPDPLLRGVGPGDEAETFPQRWQLLLAVSAGGQPQQDRRHQHLPPQQQSQQQHHHNNRNSCRTVEISNQINNCDKTLFIQCNPSICVLQLSRGQIRVRTRCPRLPWPLRSCCWSASAAGTPPPHTSSASRGCTPRWVGYII